MLLRHFCDWLESRPRVQIACRIVARGEAKEFGSRRDATSHVIWIKHPTVRRVPKEHRDCVPTIRTDQRLEASIVRLDQKYIVPGIHENAHRTVNCELGSNGGKDLRRRVRCDLVLAGKFLCEGQTEILVTPHTGVV